MLKKGKKGSRRAALFPAKNMSTEAQLQVALDKAFLDTMRRFVPAEKQIFSVNRLATIWNITRLQVNRFAKKFREQNYKLCAVASDENKERKSIINNIDLAHNHFTGVNMYVKLNLQRGKGRFSSTKGTDRQGWAF